MKGSDKEVANPGAAPRRDEAAPKPKAASPPGGRMVVLARYQLGSRKESRATIAHTPTRFRKMNLRYLTRMAR
jgi:hypothetical protein